MNRLGKAAFGALRAKPTEVGEFTVMAPMLAASTAQLHLASGLASRLTWSTTACPSSGLPSLKVTPSGSSSVQAVASAFGVKDLARWGRTAPLSALAISGS